MSAKVRHLAPTYSRSKGYVKLTYCPACNTLGMYEDMHPVRPCHFCGGRVVEGLKSPFSGKWERTNSGLLSWLEKEEGVWHVTTLTKIALGEEYTRYREQKKEADRRANLDSTFYDLDFTHLKEKK